MRACPPPALPWRPPRVGPQPHPTGGAAPPPRSAALQPVAAALQPVRGRAPPPPPPHCHHLGRGCWHPPALRPPWENSPWARWTVRLWPQPWRWRWRGWQVEGTNANPFAPSTRAITRRVLTALENMLDYVLCGVIPPYVGALLVPVTALLFSLGA